jgi:hypothetical protein
MIDLELVPTENLIQEILSRETFFGIIIKSVDELTTQGECPELTWQDIGNIEVHCQNVSPPQAYDILVNICARLREEE